jgi:hypothetical protein
VRPVPRNGHARLSGRCHPQSVGAAWSCRILASRPRRGRSPGESAREHNGKTGEYCALAGGKHSPHVVDGFS